MHIHTEKDLSVVLCSIFNLWDKSQPTECVTDSETFTDTADGCNKKKLIFFLCVCARACVCLTLALAVYCTKSRRAERYWQKTLLQMEEMESQIREEIRKGNPHTPTHTHTGIETGHKTSFFKRVEISFRVLCVYKRYEWTWTYACNWVHQKALYL